jgi:hypothetical protein
MIDIESNIEAEVQKRIADLQRQAFLEGLKTTAPYVPPPKQPDTVDQLRAKVAEARRIEMLKQPATWVPPPPAKSDGELRAVELERLKQPQARRA